MKREKKMKKEPNSREGARLDYITSCLAEVEKTGNWDETIERFFGEEAEKVNGIVRKILPDDKKMRQGIRAELARELYSKLNNVSIEEKEEER